MGLIARKSQKPWKPIPANGEREQTSLQYGQECPFYKDTCIYVFHTIHSSLLGQKNIYCVNKNEKAVKSLITGLVSASESFD